VDPVGGGFNLRHGQVRFEGDRPSGGGGQYQVGLDVCHGPRDLQQADAVYRTAGTGDPDDDAFHAMYEHLDGVEKALVSRMEAVPEDHPRVPGGAQSAGIG
jgi:hypothetical protein